MGGNDKVEIPLKFGVIRAIAVVILLMAAIGAFYSNNDAKVATRTVVDPTGGVLDLTGAPGDKLRFTIQRNSVKGEWASEEGLTLILDGQSSLLVEPRKKRWGETIAYSAERTDHDYKINSSIIVPSSATPGETIGGRITGDILRPSSSGSGFRDTSDTVSISITIAVVTPGVAAANQPGDYEKSILIRNISLSVGGAAVIVILVSYLLQWRWLRSYKRRQLVQ